MQTALAAAQPMLAPVKALGTTAPVQLAMEQALPLWEPLVEAVAGPDGLDTGRMLLGRTQQQQRQQEAWLLQALWQQVGLEWPHMAWTEQRVALAALICRQLLLPLQLWQ